MNLPEPGSAKYTKELMLALFEERLEPNIFLTDLYQQSIKDYVMSLEQELPQQSLVDCYTLILDEVADHQELVNFYEELFNSDQATEPDIELHRRAVADCELVMSIEHYLQEACFGTGRDSISGVIQLVP